MPLFSFPLMLPDWFRQSLNYLTQAINNHAVEIHDLTESNRLVAESHRHLGRHVHALSVEVQRLALCLEVPYPVPASSVRITDVKSEPLETVPPEEIPMAQFHIGVEGCKATLVFNGPIDGEPTLTGVGVATMTADSKVEVTTDDTSDDPSFIETHVTLHFKAFTGSTPGFFGVSGSAIADNPDTAEQETILIDFPQVGEYISPAQTKATSVSLATEVEPL